MPSPHSLIAACKTAATYAGLTWARAQPIYRALQQWPVEEPLLPLSRGRSICLADPKHVARFLIGLALTDDHHRVGALVYRFSQFRPVRLYPVDRHPLDADFSPPETVESALAAALREGWTGWTGGEEGWPQNGLSYVEFEPDEDPPGVRISYFGGFSRGARFVEDPDEKSSDVILKPLVRTARLSGILLNKLSREIVWGDGEGGA